VTAQISDSVCYKGDWYALAGIRPRRGGPPFDPSLYDLRVRPITTACWRGYVCSYEVNDDRLELVSVDLGVSDPPAELFGAPVSQGAFGSARYEPIRVPQPFDGGLWHAERRKVRFLADRGGGGGARTIRAALATPASTATTGPAVGDHGATFGRVPTIHDKRLPTRDLAQIGIIVPKVIQSRR